MIRRLAWLALFGGIISQFVVTPSHSAEIKATGDEVITAYGANRINADKVYKGKRVELSEVEVADFSGDLVVLHGKAFDVPIYARFPSYHLEDMVHRGDRLKLNCKSVGLALITDVGNPYFKDCHFEILEK